MIEFTGPLGDNCEDKWVFHLPLTGDWTTWPNGTPSGAGALVFQVTLPNDVEWLDAGFQVWEPPGENPGQGEDPDFPTEYEMFPDLCEEPKFTYESHCAAASVTCRRLSVNSRPSLLPRFVPRASSQSIGRWLAAPQRSMRSSPLVDELRRIPTSSTSDMRY